MPSSTLVNVGHDHLHQSLHSNHPSAVRISVGLEHIEDLKQDFRQGIKAVLEKLSKQ
jgi:cystathionine beta-lyase/cystathionine gamma-synthase